jgi:hypothetical protein
MRPLYVIIILGVLIGAGFYYRDSLAQKVADLYPSQTIPPTPDLAYASPSPSPTATPTPVPSPSATPLASIAQITPGQPLPKAGPELDLAATAGLGVMSGGGLYYWQLRRRLRDSLKKISIL